VGGSPEIKDLAKSLTSLSFGQKSNDPPGQGHGEESVLLIADDPAMDDVANRRRILKILERIGQTQTNLLYITDRGMKYCLYTHVMRLQKGKLLQQGRKEEILRKAETPLSRPERRFPLSRMG